MPIAPGEEDLFKVSGPAGLEVLGFLPSSAVPRFHFMGPTVALQGDARVNSAQIAITALARALQLKAQVVITSVVQ